jgi:hypothetical protein
VVVRLILWSLADTTVTVGELRDQLRQEEAGAFTDFPGLRFKAWVSDDLTERWGAIELWDSAEAADGELPGRARELIGKGPEIAETFDLEATLAGAPELSHLGLAFE